MDPVTTKKRLEDAAERYNEGLYEEAMALWRQVLADDPSNQKAREGIRMASLLTSDWEAAPAVEEVSGGVDPAEQQETRARIEAGLARVKELAKAGELASALEGCELLAEIAPDLPEVKELTAKLKRQSGAPKAAGRGGIGQHLEKARSALADGRNQEAAQAAKKVLEIDPGNMEACGILSLAADDDMAAAPLSIGGAVEDELAAEFDTGSFPLDDQTESTEPQSGGDPKVKALITQGKASMDAGHPEAAIEIWSRVFAIDQANSEAGTLIDRAKANIEEHARRADEIYYRAVDANDAGGDEEAIDLFEQVLAIAPNHPEARASIEEIRKRQAGGGIAIDPDAASEVSREKKRGFSTAEADAEAIADLIKEPASVPLALQDDTFRAPAPPPITALKEIGGKPAILARKRGGGSKKPLVATVGAAVVVLAGVGAWLWFGSGGGSMPEAQATVPVPVKPVGARPAPPERPGPKPAAPLQVVPGAAPKQEPAPPPPPLDPAQLKEQAAEHTREGRQFYQERRWAEAVIAFKKGLAADPIDFDAQDQLDKAMAELQKAADLEREMTSATKYFGEGDYASALHKFYRLQQDHSDMKILDTYIQNAWFDWGVSLLQAGAVDEAVEKFDEVLQIDPRDPQAARAKEIGKRYHGRPRDTVFDAFANALPLRPLDHH